MRGRRRVVCHVTLPDCPYLTLGNTKEWTFWNVNHKKTSDTNRKNKSVCIVNINTENQD